ncbi:MAG TPA: glycosyltransferase [Bryobacteraceae bacterium]|nr:glycosyltransferase [Bryobacteraceae bacterium]
MQLEDYAEVAGRDVIEELRVLAEYVKGRRLQNINSTPVGGGVAEILTRLVPLLRELGIETTWDVIKGDETFFNVTKAFHNALHGVPEEITEEMLECYRQTTEQNLREVPITGDVVFIHDPQPAGLIAARNGAGARWVWRCHIDVSSPEPRVWEFLRPLVERYDAAIFSMPGFAQKLPVPQFMVAPSIDPLSAKNRELEPRQVSAVFEKYHIDPGRPVLTQISRFDRLKDPLGVIAAYRMVKRRHDCQLVLAGGGASDDPEGEQVLREVQEAAAGDPDIHVLLLPPFSDLEINALVRGSTIVLQKSIKEGFGLTVSEALWKKKPVIGGAVGGIRLQVIHGVTGFLVHSPEGAAMRAAQLLADSELRRRMGENGYLHVKQNFLLTRHVKDYMLVMLALEHPGEDIVSLGAPPWS